MTASIGVEHYFAHGQPFTLLSSVVPETFTMLLVSDGEYLNGAILLASLEEARLEPK